MFITLNDLCGLMLVLIVFVALVPTLSDSKKN